MRTRLLAVGSLAAVLCTATPLIVRAQNGTPPPAAPGQNMPRRQHRERHPELMRALRTLQRAKMDLNQANRDFGGHRAKAAELTEQAIQETQAAIQFDKN
jgi:hypothetical protein